jgi:hypothetical protein
MKVYCSCKQYIKLGEDMINIRDVIRCGLARNPSTILCPDYKQQSVAASRAWTSVCDMSLQVNIASPDIAKAYQDVLNDRGINWAVFTYEKASNDLRVQSTGSGGLEELEEEFSDGRYVLDAYPLFICS